MKDFMVSVMLLTQLNEMLNNETPVRKMEDIGSKTGQIIEAFIDIFIKCNKFPNGLTKVIMPIIEKSNTWSLFDTSTILGKTVPVPVWLLALIKQLKAFLDRVIEPGIRLLLNKLSSPPLPASPLSTFLKDSLPCGCQPVKAPDDNSNSSVKDLVAECMYSVITQLVIDIHSLPLPVVVFFRSAQEVLAQKGISSPMQSFGLKVLATALRMALMDMEEISGMIGWSQMEKNFKDHLSTLSECIYHLLTNPNYDRGSGTPRIAGLFMKANRNWTTEQIEAITEHFQSQTYETADSRLLEGDSAEYQQLVLFMQCQSILASKTGPHSMSLVETLLLANTNWLFSQLDCPVHFTEDTRLSAASPTDPSFVLSLDSIQSTTGNFNPLEIYRKLGNFAFDQSKLLDFKYDWTSLIQADLGLSSNTFCRLLVNRPDIRDSSSLDEAAKRMVEVLRKKFLQGPELLLTG